MTLSMRRHATTILVVLAAVGIAVAAAAAAISDRKPYAVGIAAGQGA